MIVDSINTPYKPKKLAAKNKKKIVVTNKIAKKVKTVNILVALKKSKQEYLNKTN